MQNTVTDRREKSTLSPNMLIISHFPPPRLFCHCGCAASIAEPIDPQSHETFCHCGLDPQSHTSQQSYYHEIPRHASTSLSNKARDVKRQVASLHNRQFKAESLIIIRIGQRPINLSKLALKALKGRNQYVALSGLNGERAIFKSVGRMPYAIYIRLSAFTPNPNRCASLARGYPSLSPSGTRNRYFFYQNLQNNNS